MWDGPISTRTDGKARIMTDNMSFGFLMVVLVGRGERVTGSGDRNEVRRASRGSTPTSEDRLVSGSYVYTKILPERTGRKESFEGQWSGTTRKGIL